MQVTQWFGNNESPVRAGLYEIQTQSGDIRKLMWDKCWVIPPVFFVSWRGIVK